MDTSTELSIITINFNNSSGLEKTVSSVVSQTFSNFEYIVIDGGSGDGSVDVIKKYADKMAYWDSEKDSGIYDAMNKGIRAAKGEFCLFLNSGDFLTDKNILSKVFGVNHTEDILYGELIFDFGYKQKLEKLPEILDINHLFNHNVWHPATFIRRKLFYEIGFYNENYKIVSDYDFFFHAIAINKVSTKYLPFPISVYDTKGISSNVKNFASINEERKQVHKTYLSDIEIDSLKSILPPRPDIKSRNIFYRVVKYFYYHLKKFV